MDISTYQAFSQEKLGVTFNDVDLLVTAFTHRSYLNEHKKTVTEHNERLEFLGDAVLELVVTEFLYANYPEPEGVLTNWRSTSGPNREHWRGGHQIRFRITAAA